MKLDLTPYPGIPTHHHPNCIVEKSAHVIFPPNMLCGAAAAQIWRFSILIHFLKSAHALFEYVEYRVPTLTTTALEASTVCYLQENQVNFFAKFPTCV